MTKGQPNVGGLIGPTRACLKPRTTAMMTDWWRECECEYGRGCESECECGCVCVRAHAHVRVSVSVRARVCVCVYACPWVGQVGW